MSDNNILDHITFEIAGEAQQFVQRHSCALCQSHLLYKSQPFTNKFMVYCPKCGVCYPHTVTSKHVAEVVQQNELMGARELRPEKPPRPAEEILAELGF